MNIGGDERTRIVATTLKNGKLNQKQSFVVADETVNAINFKYYSLNDNGTTIVLDNIKSVAFDNSISNAISWGPAGVLCEITDKKSSNKYLEGDFNGDGLSEILITSTIDEKYYVNNVEHDQPEQGYNSYCTVTTNADSQTNLDYFILNLNPSASNILGSKDFVKVSNSNILKGDKRYVMDFNGDGRADILVLNDNKTYKVVGVKTFASAPWMDFEIIGEGILDDYKPNKHLLFGDYNGDSKTDIMIPQGDGINPGETYWNIFL